MALRFTPQQSGKIRMLVLGDSIIWGQGLHDAQKIHSQVGKALTAHDPSLHIQTTMLAHSGAYIGIDDNGKEDTKSLPNVDSEVPTKHPTVLQQCAQEVDAPETVDVILLNGGINDVDVGRFINPLTPHDTIAKRTEMHCYGSMKTLLGRLATKYSRATIIVLGYYPLFSQESHFGKLNAALIVKGIKGFAFEGAVVGKLITGGEKELIAANCRHFVEQSNQCFQQAIAEINSEMGGETRLHLAKMAFGPQHAALASDPWLFGINRNLTPEDHVAPQRARACKCVGRPRTRPFECKRASLAHPNARGAEEYAKAIIPLLCKSN